MVFVHHVRVTANDLKTAAAPHVTFVVAANFYQHFVPDGKIIFIKTEIFQNLSV
jgi:hypothetical protein